MPPITEAELRAAFLDLYEELRRFNAGHSLGAILRVAEERHETLWRRLKTEKPGARSDPTYEALRRDPDLGRHAMRRPDTDAEPGPDDEV